MSDLVDAALGLLRDDEDYIRDACEGVRVGNSIVGSLLSIMHGAPRWATEHAVAEALAVLAAEERARRAQNEA